MTTARQYLARGLMIVACAAVAWVVGYGPACASAKGARGRDARSAVDPAKEKDATMTDPKSFALQLSATGSELRAVLINQSASAKIVLLSGDLQPSQLKLVSTNGKKVPYFDMRDTMKLDNTPYCRLFKSVAPGEKIELGFVRFVRSGSDYAGTWGPYSFAKLSAGEYKAEVTWRSESALCFDETAGKMRELSGVWLGVVRSNEVSLQLR